LRSLKTTLTRYSITADRLYAIQNHPSDEHLLPLFVAQAQAVKRYKQRNCTSFTYGVFSMAAYAFR